MNDFLDKLLAIIPDLRRYAMALLRDRFLADDLVQDSLELAIRNQSKWQPGTQIKSWAFKIMLNRFRDDRRKYKRHLTLISDNDHVIEPLVTGNQEARVALREVAGAIEALPDDQKQVLLLVVLSEFSYKQAAEILNIPMGTFMSRLGRARENLRLETELGGYEPAAEKTR